MIHHLGQFLDLESAMRLANAYWHAATIHERDRETVLAKELYASFHNLTSAIGASARI